jgi:hypothetical protein
LDSLPGKVTVVKEHVEMGKVSKEVEDDLIEKARNLSKNLRSALNEAESLKTDPAEDREFDYVWNKLHEDAEKVKGNHDAQLVEQLNKLLEEKQEQVEKMDEERETQKLLHERALRELKKENDVLMRENKNLEREMENKAMVGRKGPNKGIRELLIF